MQPLATCVAALAVSAIFCIWKNYHQHIMAKQRRLRHRVAFMLWTMANGGSASHDDVEESSAVGLTALQK